MAARITNIPLRAVIVVALLAVATQIGAVQSPGPVGETPVRLRVMTFNVWHGLRAGESNTKFPGEDEERKKKRFAWQVHLIQELDPDILLFQEVNPNQPQARASAPVIRSASLS